jgi:hypothetical protein
MTNMVAKSCAGRMLHRKPYSNLTRYEAYTSLTGAVVRDSLSYTNASQPTCKSMLVWGLLVPVCVSSGFNRLRLACLLPSACPSLHTCTDTLPGASARVLLL